MIRDYDYGSASDYDFDTSLIEIVSGKAQLRLIDNPGQLVGTDYSTSEGFTFDSDKIIFDDNSFKQKSQIPSGTLCHATYDTSIDLTWGGGTLTGTAVGSAAVSGGELDLAHNDLRYVDYTASGNAGTGGTGCVRFKVTPNYSGLPGNDTTYYLETKTANNNNRLELFHRASDGALRILIADSAAVNIIINIFGTWSPTASQKYEFELNWNVIAPTGATRLFIDGTQQGSTYTQTGTRTTDIDIVRIGSNRLASANSNFKLDELMIFDSVQHVADYTPVTYAIPYEYVEAVIVSPPTVYPGPGHTQSYQSFNMGTEENSPRYIGNDLYWTGSAWATSNGTYAQATTEADINTNLGAFPVSDTVIVKIVFPDGNGTQGVIDNLILDVTNQKYSETPTPITPKLGVLSEGFDTATFTTTTPADTEIKYTVIVDTIENYFDGGLWVPSTGYSQNNTESEISANISSLDLLGGKTVKIRAYMKSDITMPPDIQETPDIDNVQVDFNFRGVLPADPNECSVFGYIYDNNGDPLSGVLVTAKLDAIRIYNDEIIIAPKKVSVTTDALGYWDMSIIENANMDAGASYNFTFDVNGTLSENKVVPNETSKNYALLLGP